MCLCRTTVYPGVIPRTPNADPAAVEDQILIRPQRPFWRDDAAQQQQMGPQGRRTARGQHHKCPICQHLNPTQSAMLAALASLFECTFLLFTALGALASIVQPKVKQSLLLAVLPLAALLPAVLARAEEQGGDAAEKTVRTEN